MKIVTILGDLPLEDIAMGDLRARIAEALGTKAQGEIDSATLTFDRDAGTFDVVAIVDDGDMRFGDGVPH